MSTVKIRRSGTASSTPSSLDHGELAINYADDTLFWKDSANVIQSFVFQAYASATHKSTHATGGSDALSPSDIGAAPAASPAITGNATFEASSGVPVTITNTGTGNSFVVNDGAGDTTPFVVDADGKVGIRGATPSSLHSLFNTLCVGTGGAAAQGITIFSQSVCTLAFGDTAAGDTADSARGYVAYTHTTDTLTIGTNNATRITVDSTGKVGVNRTSPATALDVNGVITVSAGTAAAPALVFSGDTNTGIAQLGGADSWSVVTGGVERLRVGSAGTIGLGGVNASNVGLYHRYTLSSASTRYAEFIQPTIAASSSSTVSLSTAGAIMEDNASVATLVCFQPASAVLGTNSSITNQYGFFIGSGFTQATNNYGVFTGLNAGAGRWNIYSGGTANNYFGGNVGIGSGRTTPASALDVNGVITVSATSGSAGSYAPSLTFSGDANTGFGQVSGQSDTASIFTAGAERLRVDSGGNVGIGHATPADFNQLMNSPRLVVGNGTNSAGVTIYGGTASAGTVAFADGTTTTDQYRGAVSYSHSADALRFYAGSAERVRVKATGAVRFVPLSADPATGEAGDVYYNSSTNKLRVYNGTSWIDLH